MGYPLIWLESLAAVLLFEALVIAVSARGRWGWRLLPWAVALLLFAAATTLTVFAWQVYAGGPPALGPFHVLAPANGPVWQATTDAAVPASLVLSLFAWTVSLGLGALVLLWWSARRRGESAAGSWPRGRLAVAWLVAVVLTVITFTNLDQAVKFQLTSVRAEAGAIAVAHAPPRLPDRDNAALVYRRAFEALAPLKDLPEALPDMVNAWRSGDRSKIDPKDRDLRDYLRARAPALALVRKAAAMPGCSFDYNYLRPLELLLPELQQLREAASDLSLDAVVKASDGDAHGALLDVAALYGIAAHFNDPFIVSVLMAASIEKTAGWTLEDVLARSTPTPEDLARLPLEPAPSYQLRLHQALEMEEAFGLTAFGELGSGDTGWLRLYRLYDGPPWLLDDVLLPFYRVFLLRDDLAGYRGMMKIYQNVTRVPYHEAPPRWWEEEGRVLMTRAGVLTRLLIPAINRARQSAAEGDAMRRLGQVALALRGYHAKKDRYPESLDALVPDYLPEVPRDPFDGKPLHLKNEGKGAVVYSVGADLKDDGGKPWDPNTQTGDLVFRLK